MKKLKNVLPVLVLFLALSFNAFAQAPHFMSYQAVVRNASNNLVVNANVGVKVTILQGTATGTVVFAETHTVMTNGNGLATLAIGNGTNVSGSIATIAWTAGPFFIMTETDPTGGSNYTIASTTQLMSVPYSLYAETSGSSTPGPKGDKGDTGAQGPIGPVGPQGPAGSGGMSVNCLECHDHNPATASGLAKAKLNAENEIEYSKHFEGAELSVSEGGTAGCAPCHSHEGMHSVVDGNVIPTMVLGGNGKYTFSYNATAASTSNLTTMPGKIDCWTCHKGGAADSMALYTTAPVPMTMYPVNGSATPHTINLTQHESESNLCVKCHQPRPMTTSTTLSNGQSVNYDDLAANPSNMFFDSAVGNAAPNKLIPSYRMHNHYGAIGGIYSGFAGVQFPGNKTYPSGHTHNTVASCQTCHMAAVTGTNGGHSFTVSKYDDAGAKTWNFKGCNTSGCHSNMSATSTTLTGKQSTTLALILTLADKLRSGGIEIMHKETDPSLNIFAHVTPAGYDGYLDIYDPSTNPAGHLRNPAPSTAWTAAQKATNLALPKLTSLLNVQMGAIINFQLSVREYSLGVHNPSYTDALLNNTIDALTDAGF